MAAATLAVVSLAAGIADATPQRGSMVVANRGSGTISVISVRTDAVATHALPAGPNQPEPMYVFHSPFQQRVFVGDRANDRVVALNAHTFEVEGLAAAGAGVFHMWGCRATGELWVNNDIDNTISVIDMRTLETVATIPSPADLVAMGGKPHDVIVDQQGRFAYISVTGVAGPGDYLVQVDARDYTVLGRAPVGDDPHLSLAAGNRNLYVPAQGSDMVSVLDRRTLDTVAMIPVPGAHGAAMRLGGRVFYTTNLPGGGSQAIWVIDARSNTVIGDPVDTPYAVPHNLALTPSGRKIYVTHSGGASDKVTVFGTRRGSPIPTFVRSIDVGLNPFGIAYVP